MTEELHHKVINIFQRHRRGDHFHFEVEEGGELVISPDGFNYVTFRLDRQGEGPNEEALWEIAEKKHYIIKMLEHHKEMTRLCNYYVPAERLEDFLSGLSNRPGKIVEIERFIPDTTA